MLEKTSVKDLERKDALVREGGEPKWSQKRKKSDFFKKEEAVRCPVVWRG